MRATSPALAVVTRWLAAVNAGDADAAVALSAPDIRLVGPRGAAVGHDALRAWLAHAGATFTTRSAYALDGAVVVAQHATWRDAATGAARGEAEVATRFVVAQGKVAELERHDALEAALAAAGLEPRDRAEPSPPGFSALGRALRIVGRIGPLAAAGAWVFLVSRGTGTTQAGLRVLAVVLLLLAAFLVGMAGWTARRFARPGASPDGPRATALAIAWFLLLPVAVVLLASIVWAAGGETDWSATAPAWVRHAWWGIAACGAGLAAGWPWMRRAEVRARWRAAQAEARDEARTRA